MARLLVGASPDDSDEAIRPSDLDGKTRIEKRELKATAQLEALAAVGKLPLAVDAGGGRQVMVTKAVMTKDRRLRLHLRFLLDGKDVTPADGALHFVTGPPLLIADPAGTEERVRLDPDGKQVVRTYRVDPEAALRPALIALAVKTIGRTGR